MTQYLEFTTAAPNATLWDTPPTGVESYPVATDALRALCEGGLREAVSEAVARTAYRIFGVDEQGRRESAAYFEGRIDVLCAILDILPRLTNTKEESNHG